MPEVARADAGPNRAGARAACRVRRRHRIDRGGRPTADPGHGALGLLATRSLAWNESFTRAGMFLSALSGAIVALALVAQATDFGGGFVLFSLVILPVVLFIGLATFHRMGAANYYDALCVVGMNRIRHAYVELAPEVERYLVMGIHDDAAGVGRTMGTPPRTSMAVQVVVSTPFVVRTVNAVIGAVIVGLLAHQLGLPMPGSVVAALVALVAVLGLQIAVASRGIAAAIASYRPMFPAPDGTRPAPATPEGWTLPERPG